MDKETFWGLIDQADNDVADPFDACAVAQRATALLAERPVGEIIAAQQVLWDLMAESYRDPLWGAAYLINGGCSDDGFDCFRAWLISRGKDTFERAVASPDSLAADLVVRVASIDWIDDLNCEDMLSVPWDAHRIATGHDLPHDSFTIDYPLLEDGWDFEDDEQTRRHLPDLWSLYAHHIQPT